METLQVTKDSALKAHNEASKNGKVLLENLFGKKTFQLDIKERIKTLDDAILELGETDVEVIELRKLQNAGITSHILKQQMAVVIIKSLNEGWIADWRDSRQYKYFAWFHMGSSSGSGFSYYDFADWHTSSHVGSRLALKSSELAKYVGTQFLEIFKDFMTI